MFEDILYGLIKLIDFLIIMWFMTFIYIYIWMNKNGGGGGHA